MVSSAPASRPVVPTTTACRGAGRSGCCPATASGRVKSTTTSDVGRAESGLQTIEPLGAAAGRIGLRPPYAGIDAAARPHVVGGVDSGGDRPPHLARGAGTTTTLIGWLLTTRCLLVPVGCPTVPSRRDGRVEHRWSAADADDESDLVRRKTCWASSSTSSARDRVDAIGQISSSDRISVPVSTALPSRVMRLEVLSRPRMTRPLRCSLARSSSSAGTGSAADPPQFARHRLHHLTHAIGPAAEVHAAQTGLPDTCSRTSRCCRPARASRAPPGRDESSATRPSRLSSTEST